MSPRQSIPRLSDAQRLRVQIENMTAAYVDVRQYRRDDQTRAVFHGARALRAQSGAIDYPLPWLAAEDRVRWAIRRIRVSIGDAVPTHPPGSPVTFPPGEGPISHTREDDIRLVLDYLEELTR